MEKETKEEIKQSPEGDKIRKPYTVSEKKLEQLRLARERWKKKREEEAELKVQELLNQFRENARKEEADRLAKERIEQQAALDSSKIAVAAEPALPSTHMSASSAEVKEVESPPKLPVREVPISQMAVQHPELPRQRNVAWSDMENVRDEEVDDTATALQMLRSSAPIPIPKDPYPRGTGAGNHAPFENESDYREPVRHPVAPVSRTLLHHAVPPTRPAQQVETLDEQSIRFLSTLPKHVATRVLSAMMSDEPPEYDPQFERPLKRPAPVRVADDFMSHARVAQSYHPSRLQQSLHPAYESGSQFVWM